MYILVPNTFICTYWCQTQFICTYWCQTHLYVHTGAKHMYMYILVPNTFICTYWCQTHLYVHTGAKHIYMYILVPNTFICTYWCQTHLYVHTGARHNLYVHTGAKHNLYVHTGAKHNSYVHTGAKHIYMYILVPNTFICTYWCQTQFTYQMMFVSFSSNLTGATSGAEISRAPEFTPYFYWVFYGPLSFCVLFLLVFALSVLRYIDSSYLFSIFQPFFVQTSISTSIFISNLVRTTHF